VSTHKGVKVVAAIGFLLASLVVGPPASAAPATYEVQVGAPLFALPAAHEAPADGMRFYAPPLAIHQGDIITFTFAGFHTATLLPANTDADAWVADNAIGLGLPYSFVTPDPDEGPDGVKINGNVILPSQLDCGEAANPCPYDGSDVVNSGVFDADDLNAQEFTFSVTINASVGSTVTVLCLVHLAMRLDISVVAATDVATTQEEIDTFAAQKSNHDARAASKLHKSLLETVPGSGPGVLDAYVGYDGPHFALDAMYPDRLDLRTGQRVMWHFDKLVFEDHTVTLPTKKGVKISNRSFVPVCDPDGDTGTMPDEPADPSATTLDAVCAGGVSQLEFDVDARFGPPAGDGQVTSTHDFENSGFRGANAGITDAYVVRFPAPSEDGPYTFVCMVHPFMRGKVDVA